ncbi:hypothetical protein D3C85_1580080 [compost metagenome]
MKRTRERADIGVTQQLCHLRQADRRDLQVIAYQLLACVIQHPLKRGTFLSQVALQGPRVDGHAVGHSFERRTTARQQIAQQLHDIARRLVC